ncbi:MAG: hypothetical protein EOR86_13300 [Mesorhizobium sp.]|uniref:hypothetical protein n=1 Tax=Mesorhizobium sp. TaxID=1871066 RepID=UPI000FE7CA47|nr:hypothetical protein [Mesorhizobium sp.]RWM96179.1 MAG: hypothetical protein EOR86_13300 [Mesorhizobium sp.]
MNDGGGHDYITFGWIATIIGLLLFAAIDRSHGPGFHQSSYYEMRCAQQYPDSPFGTGKAAQPSTAGSQGQPDWCDLAAQQSVAEDTAGMHWAAWAGVLFTGFGIFFVWRTLNANNAAVAQARDANKIAREAFQAQLRAYLLVKSVDASFVSDPKTKDITGVTIRLVVKNGGQTPAMNVGHDIRLSETIKGEPPEDSSQWKSVPVTMDMRLHRSHDLGPGDEVAVIDQTIPIMMFDSFERKGGVSCLLHCRLQYTTVVNEGRLHDLILNYWIAQGGNHKRTLRIIRSGQNATT